MMEEIWAGKIDCVLVKDLTRFGRNFIESGMYIEQIFPFLGVRFISANDKIDSASKKGGSDDIVVPFLNLLSDAYSMDLSKKIRSAKHIKMRRGEYIIASATYGYIKNDTGTWEPDEDTAAVVRKIFKLALEGASNAEIRNILFEAGHPTPGEHMNLRHGKDITPKCIWTTSKIRHILTNPQYIGTYVAGRRKSSVVGSRKVIHLDKSEWIMIPDHHPPIISKDIFEAAQKIVTAKTRTSCHRIKVSTVEPDDVVLSTSKKQNETMLNLESISNLHKAESNAQHLAECENQVKKLVEQRQALYEKFIMREINKETYESQKNGYNAQLDRLNIQISLHKSAKQKGKLDKKSTYLLKKS